MEGPRPVVAVMDERIMALEHLGAELQRHATVVVAPDRAELAAADAAIVYPDHPLTRELLGACDRLVVVTQLGTALHVDVEAATELGVVVLHNPGSNSVSVAEHTIGLLLAIAKRIPRSDRVIRDGEPWVVGGPELFGHEVRGKTIGLLGFGAVGRVVAQIASAGLGMHVVVFERDAQAVLDAGYEVADIDTLVDRADVVSVHLPLTPATRHLLDRDRLSRMKPSAFLVHTARAEVVDYDALHEALTSGWIAGAAFDTWPGHAPNPDSPLIALDNVVMTQHNAGLTYESARRMADAVVGGLMEVLNGERPTAARIVDPEVWDRRRRYRGSHRATTRQI